MKLSIVIPIYNEERTVAELIEKVRAVPLEKQIIVVNDCSTDGTKPALASYEKIPGIVVHHNPVNLGKGSSVRTGFSYAEGDIVAIQDGDLELDPQEFVKLIVPIVEGGADVVYGSRFLDGTRKGTLTFYLANRLLAVTTNLLYGTRLTDIETCYKVLRRDVLQSLTLKAARFEIEPELTAQLLKRGFRIVELPIGYQPRSHSEGKKLSWTDGFAALSMLFKQRIQK